MREPDSCGYADVWVHGERPTFAQKAFQAPAWVATSHWVNCAVDPEPSERTTGTMVRPGSCSPGLSAVMDGSSHLVMVPVNMPAITGPDSRRFVTRALPIFRLYMKTVPPAVTGMYAKPRWLGTGSKLVPSCTPYGMSEAAQSTVPCLKFVRPVVEPTPL